MDSRKTLLLTGSSGFLGSALAIALAKDYRVVAVDQREPGPALRWATPGVRFERADIGDQSAVQRVFRDTLKDFGTLDFVVHFAAFYHFDLNRRPEYLHTNVEGTRHVVAAAADAGAKRLIFASSIGALALPPAGAAVDEKSPIGSVIPYGWSKGEGEAIVTAAADRLPAAIVRIGAVFSDWCELPLLWSLMKRWGGQGLASRVMPGRGATAFPFIHRDDLARLVMKTLQRSDGLPKLETLLASQHGAVTHQEIFDKLQELTGHRQQAIHMPVPLARLGVRALRAASAIAGETPYERPWMLDYVDQALCADTTHTRKALDWDCAPDFDLLRRFPVLFEHFQRDRANWEIRNARRTQGAYVYED